MRFWLLPLFALSLGCASGGVHLKPGKSMRLRVGMSVEDVQRLFGDPIRKRAVGRRAVWKYRVHTLFGGWNPVYVVFGEGAVVERWFEREQDYADQLRLWGELIP